MIVIIIINIDNEVNFPLVTKLAEWLIEINSKIILDYICYVKVCTAWLCASALSNFQDL